MVLIMTLVMIMKTTNFVRIGFEKFLSFTNFKDITKHITKLSI